MEEKIRIVLEGLRAEESISALCCPMYYGWSKEFLRPVNGGYGGTACAAISDEVKDLRREATALNEVMADLTLANCLLKKSMSGMGRTRMRYSASGEARDHPVGRAVTSAGQAHLGQLGIPRATFYRLRDR